MWFLCLHHPMQFALVGKGDGETSSLAWCPADEQALVDAQEANAKCLQHLPPAQASEQLLSEGVPWEDRVWQSFFSAYSIFATVHSFWPTKFSTDRTSDGLLRPVSIISKFNRIDCEWAEPERLGFAKNMPLKVLPASRLVSHLLVKEGGCSLEWTPSQWPALPQHLYDKVNDGEAAHCGRGPESSSRACYGCSSTSASQAIGPCLVRSQLEEFVCGGMQTQGREWALHLAEVSTVLVWLQIKRRAEKTTCDPDQSRRHDPDRSRPHDPDRPTPFFLGLHLAEGNTSSTSWKCPGTAIHHQHTLRASSYYVVRAFTFLFKALFKVLITCIVCVC